MPADNVDTPEFMTELRELIERNKPNSEVNGIGVTQAPSIAAMISKLNSPLEKKGLDPTADGSGLNMVYPSISQISRQTMSRVEDSENTFKLFPDIELAAQIIISSIMSPKDMLKSELNFKLDAPEWPTEVVTKITDLIREEMVGTYGFEDEVYDILRDALFRAGSHPKLILPEAAVDHVINSDNVMATESISQVDMFIGGDLTKITSMGILGNPHRKDGKIVSALESIFGGSETVPNYDQSLYVDREKLGWIDSEVWAAEKIADLASSSTSVIDNIHYLKIPELIQKGQKERVGKAVRGEKAIIPGTILAVESRKGLKEEQVKKKITGGQLKDALYKGPKSGYKPYMSVPGSMSLRRRSVGRPLIMNLSAESVIPVYAPGDYKNHIGYFIAVDINGNPVTVDSTTAEFGQGMSTINQSDRTNGGVASYLTDRAAKNIMGDDYTPVINDMAYIYAEVIEKDLMQRMANGLYHQDVEIGKNLEIYRVMLTRALQSRATRLLYVPGEYVTYFAFKYHRNGVGCSYLDDLANLIGMRAMVLFSSLWAKIRSSISTVKTTVKLDPKDQDPIKTIEIAKHLIARSRQQYFPNGLRRVADFTDWIQSAGIEMAWEGHPKLPQTAFETETKNLDHVQPDDSLEETLRHMTYMHFGLSPETVDSAARTDFATTVQQQGVLFSKRISMLGKVFGVDATDYVQKVVSNDEIIQQKIVDIFEAHKADIMRWLNEDETVTTDTSSEDPADKVRLTRKLLTDIITRIRVSVPEPDTTSLINMKTEIENYEAILDKALDSVFSDEALPSNIIGDEASQHISNLRGAWKAYLMRRFLADNNVISEVFDIISKTESGDVSTIVNEEVADYCKSSMAIVADMLKRVTEAREAVTKDVAATGAEPGESTSSSSDESSGGGDNFGNDLGGGSDLGFGDDLSLGGEGGGGDDLGTGTPPGEDNPDNNLSQ